MVISRSVEIRVHTPRNEEMSATLTFDSDNPDAVSFKFPNSVVWTLTRRFLEHGLTEELHTNNGSRYWPSTITTPVGEQPHLFIKMNVGNNTFQTISLSLFVMRSLIIDIQQALLQTGGDRSSTPANANGGNGATTSNDNTKSGVRIYKPGEKNSVTMDMVIGQTEAKEDVAQTIRFLKNPERYRRLGARIPAGLLFTGGPGLGKTMLAKAIASAAGVTMLSISGSEFVEQFVGVGAARVRDLFKQARENAPCIIFIDEIDAIGGKRGGGGGGGAREHDQTINQLLTEMDGFDDRENIIVIAATNRADMLDEALRRPKRFDRQIVFHSPSREDREKLLQLYLPASILAADVKLGDIAKSIPGASGAVIENIANEAKLAAVDADLDVITQPALDEAVLKATMGARRKGMMPSAEEIHDTAVHEGGHALVYYKLTGKAPLRFTIVPRGNALGHVQWAEDSENQTNDKILTRQLAVAMGGKAAVEEFCGGKQDAGVSGDLRMATEIALRMVGVYGMTDAGLASVEAIPEKLLSDAHRTTVLEAVNKLLAEALETARKIVRENKSEFETLVTLVKEKETVLPDEFVACFPKEQTAAA